MGFLKFIAGDILLFLIAAITMPLWLPFWAWISFRNWLDRQRFYWECEQRMVRNSKSGDTHE